MAEFNRLPTQAELDRILFQQSLGNKTTQQIINENLAGGGFTNQDNVMQRMATGAGIAKQAVNKLGTAADVAKLFPGYTGQTKVNIPTGYNFAPKMDPYSGQVGTQGLQTQNIAYGDILKAIKPADVLGISGAEQAYSDIGAGKAPQPMDVVDTLGLGAGGIAAGKGLLGAGVKTAKYAAPAAGRMLEQYAANTGLLSPLIAYHGTPYTFNKFDTSKIGTGEGAQVYGHGIYFAENKNVAQGYADKLSEDLQTNILGFDGEEKNYLKVFKAARNYMNKDDYIDFLSTAKYKRQFGDDYFKNWLNTEGIDTLNSAFNDIRVSNQPGSLYKVDIPDKAIDTFLDWDKPLKDQPSALKKIRLTIDDKDLLKSFDYNVDNGISGGNAYSSWVPGKTPKDISDTLNKAGIQGVKYLDQGSRGTKNGTSNFVVFDPNIVKMLERNSKSMK